MLAVAGVFSFWNEKACASFGSFTQPIGNKWNAFMCSVTGLVRGFVLFCFGGEGCWGFFGSGVDATYETGISVNHVLSVSKFCWRSRGMEACVYFGVSETTSQLSTYWFWTACSKISFHEGWTYCKGWLHVPWSVYSRWFVNSWVLLSTGSLC